MAQSFNGMNCKTKPKPKRQISTVSQAVLVSKNRADPRSKIKRKTTKVYERPTTEHHHLTLLKKRLSSEFIPVPMKIMV